jgi:hypothetical protein
MLGASGEPAFVIGLLLQVPFGLLAYAVARALLAVAKRFLRLHDPTPVAPVRAAAPEIVIARGAPARRVGADSERGGQTHC